MLTRIAVKEKRANCFYLFEESALRYGESNFLWSRSGCYTWKEAYIRVCQYGNYFLSLGLQPGEFVAVYLQNSPEFIFVWQGLLSIGCAPALINYNLASDALVHCAKVSSASIMLVDSNEGCQERVRGSVDRIVSELGMRLITLSDELRTEIAASSSDRPSDAYRERSQGKIPCGLIYTRYGISRRSSCRFH